MIRTIKYSIITTPFHKGVTTAIRYSRFPRPFVADQPHGILKRVTKQNRRTGKSQTLVRRFFLSRLRKKKIIHKIMEKEGKDSPQLGFAQFPALIVQNQPPDGRLQAGIYIGKDVSGLILSVLFCFSVP